MFRHGLYSCKADSLSLENVTLYVMDGKSDSVPALSGITTLTS